MAYSSSTSSSTALLLLLNLLLFTMSYGQGPTCTACADPLRDVTSSLLPCCAALNGMTNLQAAGCLCNIIKTTAPGLPYQIDVPIAFSLYMSSCGVQVPNGFQCQ